MDIFVCLVGCIPAILPGTTDPGAYVYEPALPDESARLVWSLPARALSGLSQFDNSSFHTLCFKYFVLPFMIWLQTNCYA